ncbi:RNA polymerase sigma factor [Paenibacillus sp. MSJ-34]|uniref:RNA polymerase sigma factor n=1 Tax=Paenibacillus sp. MSJ-34 TaxID=2841529 RepID=UPI001C1197D3|nr:RNA polymerase sigma factor [Paenibacillus sp. MSJ-34]MBU5443070.1 RNA polymerase sigma factor [Paenibacillus sp. MSJ-34]
MEQWLYLLIGDFENLNEEIQKLIYINFRNLIYRDIYFLLRNYHWVEDTIQESFLKVVAKAPTLKQNGNMKAWIKRVAQNTAYDFMKKNKKYRYNLDIDLVNENKELANDEIAVADQVEQKIRNNLLNQAIFELKENYRIVLFLYYIEEKSYKEIAKTLNISVSVLTQRLARARKKLLQYFLKKWDDRK